MKIAALGLALVGSVFASACAPGYEHIVERSLPASDGLTCPGYLLWNQEPVRDVFLVVNGSGNLSNAFVHPSLEPLVRTQRVAYATYDKPGIRAPFGDPAAVHRDDDFARYTLGHGVACATAALRWARERFGASARLHVRGHSEGSLVALYTYDALLERGDELGTGVASLVLSGLALEPFSDILERQLASAPDGQRQRAVLSSCDWNILKKTWALSCAYVEDARRRPSGRAVFEHLAARAPAAHFYVFHGEHDWNTPVAPVRELEAWNAAAGTLRMEFHYYDGGHAGSDSAREELRRVLTEIVSQPSR